MNSSTNNQMNDPMNARIAVLEAQSQAECARMARAEEAIRAAHRKLRVTWAASSLAAVAMLSIGWHKDALAQGYGMTLAQAATRIAALETKTASMTTLTDPNTNQPTVRFSGVNVQVVDGTGKTENYDNRDNLLTNGTGNLIVGYNEMRAGGDGPNIRTGSHNLVVGQLDNYSAVGGAVIGYKNAISYGSCVLGGQSNTASGLYSSVSGGINNTASGDGSNVSGGVANTASGYASSVSGGYGNTASGGYSSVSGGGFNTASGLYSSVSGGSGNTANAFYSSVSGGESNTASGYASSVTGGNYVRQTNDYGFSAGGKYTSASPGIGVFHSP